MPVKMDITALARPEIVAMRPYSSARSEAPANGVLLNANESPWSLLDGVEVENPSCARALNRYPDPQPAELVQLLANLYAVKTEQILVTRGSDEGIDLLTRVFCRCGQDAIIQCTPAFGMYKIAAQTQGAAVVSIARIAGNKFCMDNAKLLDRLATDPRIKLIFLTSPNNPTGDSISRTELELILTAADGKAIVVVDEAYAEFSSADSFAPLVNEYNNLVILRTLSKAWAGAGLRCGTVIAAPEIIGLLARIIAPYPLSSPVIELAERLLATDISGQQQKLLIALAENKQRLLNILNKLDYVTAIWPGDANFVLIKVTHASALMRHCYEQKVILRAFKQEPLLENCIRISVGTDTDLDALETALTSWEKP